MTLSNANHDNAVLIFNLCDYKQRSVSSILMNYLYTINGPIISQAVNKHATFIPENILAFK